MTPIIAAARMGYGHLRAAVALAQAAGTTVTRVDEGPVAGPIEARFWNATREGYERLSALAASRGGAWQAALSRITAIRDDATGPDAGTYALATLLAAGVGRGLVEALRASGATLVATYFVPALAAERAGLPARCVVTDTDCARAWVPVAPGRLVFCAPTEGVARRLRSYGVAPGRIALTGYPLPPALTGDAEAALARRVARLRSDEPLRVMFAVGGAGAQTELAIAEIEGSSLQATFSAGTRAEVAARAAGVAGLTIVHDPRFETYAERFDAALAEVDVLWTKPSELAFYAALGLPIAATPAVGVQEERNLAWLREHRAAVPCAVTELVAMRRQLADAAERAFERLPRDGAARILATVE